MTKVPGRSIIVFVLLLSSLAVTAQEKRAMDVADIMKFE